MQDAFTVSKSDHERENRRAGGQKAGGVHRCSKTHAEGGPVRGVSRTKVLDEKLNLSGRLGTLGRLAGNV